MLQPDFSIELTDSVESLPSEGLDLRVGAFLNQ
jgi:hypothetical protein